MKSIGKVVLAVFLFLFTIAFASPSEAWRGKHHRGHRHRFGHAHKRHVIRGHHRGHKRQVIRGHHRGHKRHFRHGRHRLGHKHRVSHGHRRHGLSHGHRRHGLSIHIGYGLYGYYGIGKYRSYRYPYRHRYGYNSYKASSYYDKAYANGSGDYSRDTTTNQGNDPEDTYAHGWNLLKEGRPAKALAAFGKFSQTNPSKGVPKVGYALASAELGRLDKGIWAMRRALRSDPNALHYLTIDEELRPRVERLADRYERSARFSGRDPGGSFMLASLYYLLDDMEAAQEAIERNADSYDTSTSTKSLKRLIKEKTQVQ